MRYDKLVRDHIPTIIEKSGRTCEYTTMGEPGYEKALLVKLVEEANEARDAPDEDLVTELADVLEVVDAIIKAKGLTHQHVETIKARRLAVRGGFERRLKLILVD